ncbi:MULTISPECIES: hypothetical protein [unclassified Streptomyces]|uniref:hypothetical protein n=1 Tax=unclassified Streptomyces TaxID=2593676 RepID=UPI001F04C7A2|nr:MULTISPECIES: hypothetical protein [unclassified Streptomyces]MCH0566865.1 hypothetical protein [Streptomyces sp. MUM 2J]MCH0569838.1 hypothetical protein [Streptomyces sp. MUM 136J]
MTGYSGIVVHHGELQVVARSARDLVPWTQEHGMRANWELVPPGRRPVVEDELVEEVERSQGTDSAVTFGFPVAYFLAHTAFSI